MCNIILQTQKYEQHGSQQICACAFDCLPTFFDCVYGAAAKWISVQPFHSHEQTQLCLGAAERPRF